MKWRFVRRDKDKDGDKDVYRFTFKRPAAAGSTDSNVAAKEIQFEGKKIVVFKDPLHTVVVELPNDDDLKAAQRN